MRFAGIDPTASENRRTACAKLDQGLRLVDMELLRSDEEIVQFVRDCELIGLDAPCTLPRGLSLCCMADEVKCACREENPFKGRLAERELLRLGLRPYIIGKNAFAKSWIRRGLCLKERLERAGLRVLEVFPTGSKILLFGPQTAKKQTREGRRSLQLCLQAWVDNLARPDQFLYSHDQLDAILAALTVALWPRGLAAPVGDPEEGQIYLPRAGVSAEEAKHTPLSKEEVKF